MFAVLATSSFLIGTYGATIEVLVKENACFSASQYTNGYSFSPTENGDILGIKLAYKSGGVSCHNAVELTKWGCGEPFFVQMVREGANHESIYPKPTSNGITQFTLWVNECPGSQCSVGRYSMDTYTTQSNEIQLIDSTNPVSVTTNEIFSLQYSEGCCNAAAHDNRGQTCADVYFLYDNRPRECQQSQSCVGEEIVSEYVYCTGYLACALSTIRAKTLFVQGQRAIENAAHITAEKVLCYGSSGAPNAKMYSDGIPLMNVMCYGFNCCNGADVYCSDGSLCNIYCDGRSGCLGLTVHVDGGSININPSVCIEQQNWNRIIDGVRCPKEIKYE